MGVCMENEPIPFGAQDSGPFYHGTKTDLKAGDLLEPGYSSNYGERRTANYVYLTATLDAATWGAELAVGKGPGRIYRVEPTGLIPPPHLPTVGSPCCRTQPTVTMGPEDFPSPSTGSPISSASRMASSIRVSTIWDSGTVLMISPLTKIWPLPLPDATPRSASRASPGPFTTQPMTATRRGTSRPSRPAATWSARV